LLEDLIVGAFAGFAGSLLFGDRLSEQLLVSDFVIRGSQPSYQPEASTTRSDEEN